MREWRRSGPENNVSTSGILGGKTAVVTGGGSGIGLAIAEGLVAAGAAVIITGRRIDMLQAACARLGPNASWQRSDISDTAAQAALVAAVEARNGALDILVNNAGINMKKSAFEVTDADFSSVLRTNLDGLFALSREAGRGMAERRRGAILNIASMAAVYGLPRVVAYSASKSAVLGLTRALAVELGPMGVRVNALSPGFIFSDMTARALDADPERKQRALSRTPLGRMGTPAEVAAAAVFLCSDAASFVTGVNLCVDGGNSIGF
jgi:NAD(P)-dependent dehydrogenase (short-subunit alcohol dehydrogenase family)